MDRTGDSPWAFLGRIFVSGRVHAITGLHIGGSSGALAIGGVDQPVVRNALDGRPYIPGSSIRGKMRSLAEKHGRLVQNNQIGQSVFIHTCQRNDDYAGCDVCQVFGVPGSMRGQASYGGPTRLLVRDVPLSDASAQRLEDLQTDLPYTEIKWEAAIDRVTSAATPRQLERVPAGTVFSPLDLVFSAFQSEDVRRFGLVLQGLLWLEDDYLGGQGSRGSGKVQFQEVQVSVRSREAYAQPERWEAGGSAPVLADLVARAGELQSWLAARLGTG